ncbi:serine protease 27 [Amia ocellicauda]|uniref:serine protease 27 n=1 Tax=Amia ocellicauda TaxID=2972642 RepID=UPI0034646F89
MQLLFWILLLSIYVSSSPVSWSFIVGGQDAKMGEFPWQAYIFIQLNGTHGSYCGGSLISEHWVLSAAHCFNGSSIIMEKSTVTLGAYSLAQPTNHEEKRSVAQLILHKRYHKVEKGFDLALLQLDRRVRFSDFIRTVALPLDNSDDFADAKKCWVTGWGDISEKEELPNPRILQKVRVPIINNKQCGDLYKANCTIRDEMICAGYLKGGMDSCQGDSGGPLVCKKKGEWIQTGIVSFGYGCAKPRQPGIYTRTSSFLPWIKEHTGVAGFY